MDRLNGFTLVELIAAMTIAGVLVTVGIPSLMDLVQRNAVTTASNELLSTLLLARSEAVRQEAPTTLTPFPAGDGWQVDTVVNLVTVNQLTHTMENKNITVASNLFSAGNSITYNPRGRATTAIVAGDSIDVSFDGVVMSHICLTLTGRPFIQMASEGACP